jgi:hypothetical protein
MSEANHRDSDREAVAKKEGSEGNYVPLTIYTRNIYRVVT